MSGRSERSPILAGAVSLVLLLASLPPAQGAGAEPGIDPLHGGKIPRPALPFMAVGDDAGASGEARVKRYLASAAGGWFEVRPNGEMVYAEPGAPALVESLVSGSPRPAACGAAGPTVSIFHGRDPRRWKAGLASHESVSLGEVYPGIRLDLRCTAGSVEKVFSLAPGADPRQIRLRFREESSPGRRGGVTATLDAGGGLSVRGGPHPLSFSPPIAYQEDAAGRHPVEVRYALLGQEGDYGFTLGAYDRTKPVVIDPVLVATYFGGSGADWLWRIAVDRIGRVYAVGYTFSPDLPGLGPDSVGAPLNGNMDAMVVMLSADLRTILAVALLGGSQGIDAAFNLLLDKAGNVYVGGRTGSADFPGIGPGSADHLFQGSSEGFIVKLNRDLSQILAATYLGDDDTASADGWEQVQSLFLAGNGDLYAAGMTPCSEFPGVPGQRSIIVPIGGPGKAFAAHLDADLSVIKGAVLIGGSHGAFGESARGLAVDNGGNVFIGGETWSDDFPSITPGAPDTSFAGDMEGYVVKLNPAMDRLLAGTFLGGSGNESIVNLFLDREGNVCVAGATTSPDFPGIGAGSADSLFTGSNEAYAAKLSPDLSRIVAATYLGGNDWEGIYDFMIDREGRFVTGGNTGSTDFPGWTHGTQGWTGGTTMFITVIDQDLASFGESRLFGGSWGELLWGIARDVTGDIFIAGYSQSPDFPGLRNWSADPVCENYSSGSYDGLVARFNFQGVKSPRVVKPNGGETLRPGSFYPVRWDSPPRALHHTIRMSRNGGVTWSLVAEGIQGTGYMWHVPKPVRNLGRCLVKVTAYDAANALLGSDRSEAFFTIKAVTR